MTNIAGKRIDSPWAEEAESRISAYGAGLMVADSTENVFKRISLKHSLYPVAESKTKEPESIS